VNKKHEREITKGMKQTGQANSTKRSCKRVGQSQDERILQIANRVVSMKIPMASYLGDNVSMNASKN